MAFVRTWCPSPAIGALNGSRSADTKRTRNTCVRCSSNPLGTAPAGASTSLGQSSLRISPLGIGTLQWGDASCGFGQNYNEDSLRNVFEQLLESGINFFDTAEVYGYKGIQSGTSAEQLLGKYLASAQTGTSDVLPPVVGTKFFTIPWTNFLIGGGVRLGRKSLLSALKESLKRLGKDKVDLYQIHFPFPTFSNAALMEGLKEAVESGLASAVGVSNYSRAQMEEAADILAGYGIPLASNQVKYSLVHRNPEKDGLLQACKDRNITLIAYSPLASGLLSDKSLQSTDAKAQKVQPLLKLLHDIGAQRGGKSVSQVSLNYLISKGAVPIPGCKSVQQAAAHADVVTWRLDDSQAAALDEEAERLKV